MAVAARADATARAVSDRREIASFLRTDRRYAAYALGDLDGPNRHRVAWAMAHDANGDPIALAAHHEGLVPQPLFLMGDPDGCALILEQVLRPRDAYFLAAAEHAGAMAETYELDPPIDSANPSGNRAEMKSLSDRAK